MTDFLPYPTGFGRYTKLLSQLYFKNLFLYTFPSVVDGDLFNYRGYLYFRPSNTLTHCMVALLRKVDSVWCKELGRWTGRRSSPMEQTPPAQGTREEVGNEKSQPSPRPLIVEIACSICFIRTPQPSMDFYVFLCSAATALICQCSTNFRLESCHSKAKCCVENCENCNYV